MTEKRKTSFDDFMSIVDNDSVKTASVKSEGSSVLLDKIAEELGLNKEASAPTAEGEVSPADSSVSGAADAVVSATEAVTVPQMTIAGGNPAEAAAGEIPAATKPNEGLAISAGDGKVTDAQNLDKTPEAVAAAAKDGGGDEASAATPNPTVASAVPDNDLGSEKTAEAKQIGIVIAHSFQDELQKIAADKEYSDALDMLKEAGLMDDYTIQDEGINKTASEKLPENCLDKLANRKNVSREEIIGAAYELSKIAEEAEEADAAGRADARETVEKIASEENVKVAEALKDPEVVSAVKLLKTKNIL